MLLANGVQRAVEFLDHRQELSRIVVRTLPETRTAF